MHDTLNHHLSPSSVPVCCNGDATDLDLFSCDDQRLIGDSCLSIGYPYCVEYGQCRCQDIEVVVDSFGAVMLGVIRMNNSHIGGASESACPTESLDEDVCCAGTFISFL